MEQIKYVLYSILILVGAALTYAVMEPILFSKPPMTLESTADSKPTLSATLAVVKNIAGKNLFAANCGTCHSLSKALTGPALAHVEERGPWIKRENLLKWVSSPGAFIPTTPYTQQLATQFNGQVMPSFPQLSEQEKNQIFDYIKEASTAM
jgi:mono/diheme cytochrome c family protein